MSNRDAIETFALALYDEFNPDHHRVVNVSKADCLRIAKQRLDQQEKSGGRLDAMLIGARVSPNELFPKHNFRRKITAGVIVGRAYSNAPVWIIKWDGYRGRKHVHEKFLQLLDVR